MAAKLIVSKDNREISQVPLERTVITIGRKHVNDVHLDDPGVSGSHAKVLTVGKDSFLEDLNSTNGTFVNGNKITKTPLKDQDVIQIGAFKLRYLNSVVSVDHDMEKTVIIQAGSVTMKDPETKRPAHAATTTAPASSNDDEAKLTVVDGPSKGKFLVLSKIITRVKGPNDQSSIISKKGDDYFLLNTLPPEQAPTVNGVRVKVGSTKLNNGDLISMGSNALRFSLK